MNDERRANWPAFLLVDANQNRHQRRGIANGIVLQRFGMFGFGNSLKIAGLGRFICAQNFCEVTSHAMQIKRAIPQDAAVLTEIAFAAKRHWRYPERWIESWRDILTVEPEFIGRHETYAAVVEGQTVGFYALGRKGDRLDLLHLWLLPDAMGRGVGRSLLVHALNRTRALGVDELEIESDPNAEGFYRRLGARRVGWRVRQIEQMRRELPILICKTDHVI